MPNIDLLINEIDEKYGKPLNDQDAISKIIEIYKTKLGVQHLTEQEVGGLISYYTEISRLNQPAYYWMIDAIQILARKNNSKKTIKYYVSMLKKWMTYGYGYTPKSEEAEIVDYFEEVTSHEVPNDYRHIFNELMAEYGGIAATRMIGNLNKINPAKVYIELLKDLLEENYSEKSAKNESLRNQHSDNVRNDNVTNNNFLSSKEKYNQEFEYIIDGAQNLKVIPAGSRAGKRKKPRSNSDIRDESKIIEDFLNTTKMPQKTSEITEYLNSLGIDILPRDLSRLMPKYLSYNENIEKDDKVGYYKLKEYTENWLISLIVL